MRNTFYRSLVLSLLIALFVSPAFALAQTGDSSNATEIATLEQLVATLTKELQQLIAAKAAGATTTSTDWLQYQTIPDGFFKNPPAYIGTKVEVGGTVMDFLAAGDRGGTSNYIEMIAASSDTALNTQEFMLEIDSASEYASATAVLNKPFTTSNINSSGVIAYGTIEATQVFINASGGTVYVPVIKVDRLDSCSLISCPVVPNANYTTQSIFPAGLTSTPTQNTTAQPSSSATYTTPSGAVIDASGNVITPGTTVSLPQTSTTPTNTGGTWHTAYTYSSSVDTKTPAFSLQGQQQKILYTCTVPESTNLLGASFNGIIDSTTSGGPSDVFAWTVTCPTSNSTYEYSLTPGQYYLDISASNATYDVSVEDYY